MSVSAAALSRVGIVLSPERFTALVAEVIEDWPAQTVVDPATDLPIAEAILLREGGLDLSPLRSDEEDPLARTAAAFATLLASSLSVPETARRLKVDPSRIRQRLAARTIYGLKRGDSWHIPVFQFDGDHLLPGIEIVVEALPGDLHPMSVYRWFNAQDGDLSVDDVPQSPRDWLRQGNDPRQVAAIAEALGDES